MKKPVVKRDRKLTNLEILQLHAELKALRNVPGVKLNYAIARTLQNLKPLVEAYSQDQLIPKSEEFIKYENELKKAYEQFASKGSGAPKTKILVTPQGEMESLDIDINSEEVKEARAKLQLKYTKAIEERKAQISEYNDWLGMECEDDYKIWKVDYSEMPQENDNYKQLWDACFILIKEETFPKDEEPLAPAS